MNKEFEYKGLFFDQYNILEYMKENNNTSTVLIELSTILNREDYIKVLINSIRLDLIGIDFILVQDFIDDELLTQTVLLHIIKELKNSNAVDKDENFRNKLFYFLNIKSKLEESEDRIVKLNDFINYIYLFFRDNRKPEEKTDNNGIMIGYVGVIEKALEKSGYTINNSKKL